MTNRELILQEIERVPEPLLDKVLSFIRSLSTSASREKVDLAAVSESSLRKDWLRPEEERAWQSL